MKVVATLPPREIDGADQVLEGVVAEFESANHCRIWPATTCDPDVPLPNREEVGVSA